MGFRIDPVIDALNGYFDTKIQVAPLFTQGVRAQFAAEDHVLADPGLAESHASVLDALDSFDAGKIRPVQLLAVLSRALFKSYRFSQERILSKYGGILEVTPIDPKDAVIPERFHALHELPAVGEVGSRLIYRWKDWSRDYEGYSDRWTEHKFALSSGYFLGMQGPLARMRHDEYEKPFPYVDETDRFDLIWQLVANFINRGKGAMGMLLTTFNPADPIYGSGLTSLTPQQTVGALVLMGMRVADISFINRPKILLHLANQLHSDQILNHEGFHAVAQEVPNDQSLAFIRAMEQILENMDCGSENIWASYSKTVLFDSPIRQPGSPLHLEELIENFFSALAYYQVQLYGEKDMDRPGGAVEVLEHLRVFLPEFVRRAEAAFKECAYFSLIQAQLKLLIQKTRDKYHEARKITALPNADISYIIDASMQQVGRIPDGPPSEFKGSAATVGPRASSGEVTKMVSNFPGAAPDPGKVPLLSAAAAQLYWETPFEGTLARDRRLQPAYGPLQSSRENYRRRRQNLLKRHCSGGLSARRRSRQGVQRAARVLRSRMGRLSGRMARRI